MSQPSTSATLKTSKGNIKISAQHNRKLQVTIVFVKFNTSQRDLLSMMLQKYVVTKCLNTGVNINNSMYSAIPGETSIVFTCAENRCIQNITLLYAHLLKGKLSAQQAKCCSGDYQKLVADVSSFEVKITGKCKNVCTWLDKGNAAKITKLVSDINNIVPATRDNPTGSSEEWSITASNCGNGVAMMYLSVACGDIPCKITKVNSDAKLTFLSCDGMSRFCDRMFWKDTLQARVKTFLTQSGNPGSPSANDSGQYKEKCKYILLCQNSLAEVYSNLRGFNFSFSNVEELKRVDSDAMSAVRVIKTKCSTSTCSTSQTPTAKVQRSEEPTESLDDIILEAHPRSRKRNTK